jgi:hypothetical protein
LSVHGGGRTPGLLRAETSGRHGTEPGDNHRRQVAAAGAPAATATRAAVRGEAFAQAWAEGLALSLEQATDLALTALADLTAGDVGDAAASVPGGDAHEG